MWFEIPSQEGNTQVTLLFVYWRQRLTTEARWQANWLVTTQGVN